jgi:hypothetical protein
MLELINRARADQVSDNASNFVLPALLAYFKIRIP